METDTPITRRRFVVAAGGLVVAAETPRLLNPAIAKAAPPWSEQLVMRSSVDLTCSRAPPYVFREELL